MSATTINFNKVVSYSKAMCFTTSKGQCATYVKKAFETAGCKYVTGNGWENQRWCEINGFKLIGDFVPIGGNARAGGSGPNGLQFPEGYRQQVGDVCLIKHGTHGHICYATGTGLNDWVSDFFQRPPAQENNCGPYCYPNSIERVQFWRHSSVLNNAPVLSNKVNNVKNVNTTNTAKTISSNNTQTYSGIPNEVSRLSTSGKTKENVLKLDDKRQKEFESLVLSLSSEAPQMGREIIITSELYDTNILKGSQESRKERV